LKNKVLTFEYTVLHLIFLTRLDILNYFTVLVDISVMNNLLKKKT